VKEIDNTETFHPSPEHGLFESIQEACDKFCTNIDPAKIVNFIKDEYPEEFL